MVSFPSLAVGLGFGLIGGVLGYWLAQRQAHSGRGSSSKPAASNPSSAPDQFVSPGGDPERLAQMELAYQLALALGQFKSGFLARISHELRSPLNSMIGTQQLILNELCDSPEEEREFLAQSHEAALRMVGLIDRILEVAKVEAGTERLDVQPVSLNKVLEEVQELTSLQAQNRNLRLHIDLPSQETSVLADRRRLVQALLLLVDTPLSLMQEGAVTVTIVSEPQQVLIMVEDERPATAWQEPINLLQEGESPPLDQVTDNSALPDLSPGMKLMLSQQLLTLMQGRLEIVATPQSSAETTTAPAGVTKIQCSIPRVGVELE